MSIIFGMYDVVGLDEWAPFKTTPAYASFFQASYANPYIYFQAYNKESDIQASATISHHSHSGLTIIADARLINRKALLSEFSLKNCSDSELLLTAYQRWGIECVHHLLGNFAFALWDQNQRQLFLACDPIGERTLFYSSEDGHRFYFANLVKPLFDQGHLSKALNPPYIAELLTGILGNHDLTTFSSIKRLRSGHFLVLPLNKKPVIKRYWSAAEVQQNPLQLPSREAYYAQFRELFHQVIQDHLFTFDGPIGCHLSGGLDSSSVIATAASLLRRSNQSLTAFSYVPSAGLVRAPKKFYTYDDSCFMEALAREYRNVNLIFIQDGHKQLFDYGQTFHEWLDQPISAPTNVLWLLAVIENARQTGIKTIFTGQMGNLTLSWEGNNQDSTLLKQGVNFLRQQFHKIYYGEQIKRPWRPYSAISDTLVSKTNWLSSYRADQDSANLMDKKNKYQAYLLDMHLMRCATSFYAAIRLLYNVECIDPTADKRIIEFCLRTPNDVFNNENGSRLLVRESMRGILPEMIRNRTTCGMQAPDWYKKIERQKYIIQQQLLAWKNTCVADYIDLDHLIQQFKKWSYQRVSSSQRRLYNYYDYHYHVKLLHAMEMGFFIERHSK